MKIAICDDEIVYVEKITKLLNDFFSTQKMSGEIFGYTDPSAFLKSNLESYDTVFLDVSMGSSNGIDVARTLREKNKRAVLIYVSALVEYAPMGYEVNAFRYLLKANLEIGFHTCMSDLIKQQKRDATTYSFKPVDGDLQTIFLKNILCFESQNHNIVLHTLSSFETPAVLYGSLSSIAAQLNSKDFIRIQKSFLVNMRNVVQMKGRTITLSNGQELTCGKQVYKEVLKTFLILQGEC